MDIKKKVLTISLLSTIIHGMVAVVTSFISIISIVFMIIVSGFIKESAGMLDKPYYDSVTGGWEVLFGMIGTFLGLFVFVALAVVVLFVLLPAILNTLVMIYGVRTYNHRNDTIFKKMVRRDGKWKLILSVLSLVCLGAGGISLTVYTMKQGEDIMSLVFTFMVFCVPFVLSTILNILNLNFAKQIEEKTDNYISYEEDNSSYLWQ